MTDPKYMTELDLALSVDDQLYARFEDLNRQLQERQARFNAWEKVREVRRREGNIDIQMQILEVHGTDEGLVVIVK